MRIKCKCGRTLDVPDSLLGKKVACQGCGQRYLMPPPAREEGSRTVAVVAADARPGGDTPAPAPPKSTEPLDPAAAGAIALGERISPGWIVLGILLTLAVAVGVASAARYAFHMVASDAAYERYALYVKLAVLWGPSLAFVISGYVLARFSPGRTIAEPAIAAVISVAIITALIVFQPTPLANYLGGFKLKVAREDVALLANLFALAMFNAACLSCAGAYFGEVAQVKSQTRR